MSETGKTGLKPFHESIVDMINGIGTDQSTFTNYEMLRVFAILLKETKIPKGHDEIIAAWKAQIQRFGLNEDLGVVDSILAQKRDAEKANLNIIQ